MQTLENLTKSHKTLKNLTKLTETLQDLTKPYKTLQNLTELGAGGIPSTWLPPGETRRAF